MKKFGPIREKRAAHGAAAVKAEAAAWSDRLREEGDDADLRRAFERWRAEDPKRAETFDRIDRSYRTARRAVTESALLQAMHERTRDRVAERHRRRRRLRRGLTAGVAAALVAGVGLSLFVATGGSWRELQYMGERTRYALMGQSLYRTVVGERLAVTLDDGSMLTLNTDSRVIVDYGDDVRNIRQVHGQTLFEVTRDATRPFVVTAGNHRVTALGTAFDVRLTGDRFEITLVEGQVNVEETAPEIAETSQSPVPSPQSPASSPQATGHKPQATILNPGERYIAFAAAPLPTVEKIDVQRAISWRHGQLIFQNDPLAEAIAEFNRYAERRIVLADDRLGALPISGAFRTGNTAGFIATVSSYFGLHVAERTEDRIVLARRRG